MNKIFIGVDVNKIRGKFHKTYDFNPNFKDYLITIYGSYKPQELIDRIEKIQEHLQSIGFITGLVSDYANLQNETNYDKSIRYTKQSTINLFLFLLTKEGNGERGSEGINLEYPSILHVPDILIKSYVIFEDKIENFFNTSILEEHLRNQEEKARHDIFPKGTDDILLTLVEKNLELLIYEIPK